MSTSTSFQVEPKEVQLNVHLEQRRQQIEIQREEDLILQAQPRRPQEGSPEEVAILL